MVPADRTVRIESDRAGNLVDDTRRLTPEGRVKITIGDIKLRGNCGLDQPGRNRGRNCDPTGRMVRKADQPSRTSSVVLPMVPFWSRPPQPAKSLWTPDCCWIPRQDPRIGVVERALARRLGVDAAAARVPNNRKSESKPVPSHSRSRPPKHRKAPTPCLWFNPSATCLFAGTLEFNQGSERSEIVISRGLDLEVPANRGPIGSRLNLTARRAVLFGKPELTEAIREGRADASMPEGMRILKDWFESRAGQPSRFARRPNLVGFPNRKPCARSGHSNAR